MTLRKGLLLGLLVLLIAGFFALDLGQSLTLSQQAALQVQVAAEPPLAAAACFTLYVLVTGLSLPGASQMTLAEANKYAAGNWKRAHAPQALLRWVRNFHLWRLR